MIYFCEMLGRFWRSLKFRMSFLTSISIGGMGPERIFHIKCTSLYIKPYFDFLTFVECRTASLQYSLIILIVLFDHTERNVSAEQKVNSVKYIIFPASCRKTHIWSSLLENAGPLFFKRSLLLVFSVS